MILICPLDESTYAMLIPLYAKLGEPDQSFKLFDEMIGKNFEIDPRTLNGLVIACDMTGDTHRYLFNSA
mgnify:CR=1 FL=1